MERFLPRPTQDTWKEVVYGLRFMGKWNFPNCLGAIDGKHVTIQAPLLSGSLQLQEALQLQEDFFLSAFCACGY